MTKKSIIKSAAMLGAAGVISKVLGAIYRIPLGNILGAGGMGNYQLAHPIYTMLLLACTAGISVAVARMVAERVAASAPAEAYQVFLVSLRFLAVLGAVGCALLYFGADIVMNSLGMGSAAPSLRACGPALFIVAISSAYRGYYQGLQDLAPHAISQVVEQVVRLVCGLYFAKLLAPMGTAYSAAGATIGMAVSEVACLAVMWGYHRKKGVRYLRDKQRWPARPILEKLLRIALPTTVGALAVSLVSGVDSLCALPQLRAAGFTADEATALYGLYSGFVSPVVGLCSVFSGAISTSLLPAITAARIHGRKAAAHRQISLGMRLSMALGLPAMVVLYLFAQPILQLMYRSLQGEELARAAELLRLMAPGALFLLIMQVQTGVLQGMGRPGLPVLNILCGTVVKIAVGLPLLAIPALNIAGAAIGTVACYAICALLSVYCVMKFSGASFAFGDVVAKPALATAFMAAVAWQVYAALSPRGNTPALLTAALAAILVYGLCCYFMFRPKRGRREKARSGS